MSTTLHTDSLACPVRIPAGLASLNGDLAVPAEARALVLFAHGSGSSRHSPRNQQVAAQLNAGGLATLLFDLLTDEEEAVDRRTRRWRFDIGLLAQRLVEAADWTRTFAPIRDLDLGLFGASTGAAAALVAASRRPAAVRAVVSRGGRPDLAGLALRAVRAPTLLIVGALDTEVLALNRSALAELRGSRRLEVVAGAAHLFQEPGTLERVGRLARDWFVRWLGGDAGSVPA